MKRSRVKRSSYAFTVVELLVVVALVAVLAALVLPALKPAKSRSRISCVHNLREVGVALRVWAGDNNGFYPMRFYTNSEGSMKYTNSADLFRYFEVMPNELNTPKVLVCPFDSERKAATNFTSDFNSSHISYFVGLDADETRPGMLLAGDRNLTNGTTPQAGLMLLTTNPAAGWTMKMHQGNGNVLLADGSVQQFSIARLREAVANTGTNVNRLLFP